MVEIEHLHHVHFGALFKNSNRTWLCPWSLSSIIWNMTEESCVRQDWKIQMLYLVLHRTWLQMDKHEFWAEMGQLGAQMFPSPWKAKGLWPVQERTSGLLNITLQKVPDPELAQRCSLKGPHHMPQGNTAAFWWKPGEFPSIGNTPLWLSQQGNLGKIMVSEISVSWPLLWEDDTYTQQQVLRTEVHSHVVPRAEPELTSTKSNVVVVGIINISPPSSISHSHIWSPTGRWSGKVQRWELEGFPVLTRSQAHTVKEEKAIRAVKPWDVGNEHDKIKSQHLVSES